jgi:hypothetical protein
MIKDNFKAKAYFTVAIVLNIVVFIFKLTGSSNNAEIGTLIAVVAMFGVILGALECGALNDVEDFDAMLKVFLIVGVIFVLNVVVLPMLLK